MTEFQLETGDTGQALLPIAVPVSAIAERAEAAKRADKVKDEGARTSGSRLEQMRALSADERRSALAFLAGYAPETFDRLMQYVREGR